jgi:hypothetical protein
MLGRRGKGQPRGFYGREGLVVTHGARDCAIKAVAPSLGTAPDDDFTGRTFLAFAGWMPTSLSRSRTLLGSALPGR